MATNTAWAVADVRSGDAGIYVDTVRPTKRAAINVFRFGPEDCDLSWRSTAKIGPTQQLRAVKVSVTLVLP